MSAATVHPLAGDTTQLWIRDQWRLAQPDAHRLVSRRVAEL